MKHLKTFYEISKVKISISNKNNENHYDGTCWEDNENKVCIQDVQDYLEDINAPIIEIPVDEIKHMCVHLGKTDKETLTRSENSDLSYYIIISKNNKGWKMILDGHHRLLKAINNNIPTIKAKVLDLEKDGVPYEFNNLFNR